MSPMRPAILLAFLVAGAGCALPAQPLARVDVSGRDLKIVEADKLACWQQAEAANAPSGKYMLTGMALGYTAYALESYRTEGHDRRARIEQAAEGCMAQRGYPVDTTAPSRWP